MTTDVKPVRPVHLEVNDSGGWRRVMTFDADDDSEAVHLANGLLRLSCNPRLKARIIIPGDTAPLMNWNAADGWREWLHPGQRGLRHEI